MENDTLRKAMYQTREVDFDKLGELATLNGKIDSALVGNDTKLAIATAEEKTKNDEHQKVDEKRAKLDTNIEAYIDKLNELFANLNDKSVDIFNGLDIDTLKEEYEQGLVNTLPNTAARKAYISYMFDILKKENQIIPQVYKIAQQFVANAKKEDGFDVPELAGNNDQIMFYGNITYEVHDGLRQFADIWCRNANDNDKAITSIGNGYLNTKPFIDGMYNYAANIPTYNQDHSRGGAEYDKLHGFNNQLHMKLDEMQAKDSRSVKNIVEKIKHRNSSLSTWRSIEREPYEFATRVFDSFNSSHDVMRPQVFDNKQSIMPEQVQEEAPTNQVNGIAVPQQLTEEQRRILAENAPTTSIAVPNGDTLNSGGTAR